MLCTLTLAPRRHEAFEEKGQDIGVSSGTETPTLCVASKCGELGRAA